MPMPPNRIPFVKMHGLGNDFVVLDGRAQALPAMTAALAAALADRRTGIGCDQLIMLEPSDSADLRMRIFNADGGEVEACGNATRAVGLLHGGPARIETLGGTVTASPADGGIAVDMGAPRFDWDAIPLAYAMDTLAMPVGWDGLDSPVAVNVGNPHVMFFVPDCDAVDLARLGPEIEHDPLFPERVNVNVATVVVARGHPVARVGARRRPDPRLRHRRLRHRGRGDAPRADRPARHRHPARRAAGDRLDRRRPHRHDRRGRRKFSRHIRSGGLWSASTRERRGRHARLPAQPFRERDAARHAGGCRRARRDQQLRGDRRGGAPDPPGDPPRAQGAARRPAAGDRLRCRSRARGDCRDARSRWPRRQQRQARSARLERPARRGRRRRALPDRTPARSSRCRTAATTLHLLRDPAGPRAEPVARHRDRARRGCPPRRCRGQRSGADRGRPHLVGCGPAGRAAPGRAGRGDPCTHSPPCPACACPRSTASRSIRSCSSCSPASRG